MLKYCFEISKQFSLNSYKFGSNSLLVPCIYLSIIYIGDKYSLVYYLSKNISKNLYKNLISILGILSYSMGTPSVILGYSNNQSSIPNN